MPVRGCGVSNVFPQPQQKQQQFKGARQPHLGIDLASLPAGWVLLLITVRMIPSIVRARTVSAGVTVLERVACGLSLSFYNLFAFPRTSPFPPGPDLATTRVLNVNVSEA